MANKDSTEIALVKGVATMLNADTIFTLGYFVHTEHALDPATGREKTNRNASEYVYVGRIDKLSDLKNEIAEMASDAKCTQLWTWKGLSNYASVTYDVSNTNARGAKWLNMRIKKAVDWDMFCKIVDGWKETKKAFNANARYVSVDYVADDGTLIPNLKEAKDILIAKVGQSIKHRITLKCELNSK